MKIPKLALLTSKPFVLDGVGSLKSPKIDEILPNDMHKYMFYKVIAQVLFSKNEEIIEIAKGLGNNNDYSKMTDYDKMQSSKFKIISASRDLIDVLCISLKLFFDNEIGYVDGIGFVIFDIETKEIVGNINDRNYEIIEDLLKQLLHCQPKDDEDNIKFSSEKAREQWERAKKIKEEEMSDSLSKDFELDNLISKLCICGIGITHDNVGEKTIYQFYDAFSAYQQDRISRLSENAYAHNGGENFDPNMWLKYNN